MHHGIATAIASDFSQIADKIARKFHSDWEVLNGVGVDGVGVILPFFYAFFVFLTHFFVFFRFSSFFFAFLFFS